MNAPFSQPANARPSQVTTGPVAGSRKVHVASDVDPSVRVPFREVDLSPASGEPPLRLYDTSGPYTDPAHVVDLEAGLPRIRAPWIEARAVETYAGRAVKPEDNGDVAADKLVAACPAQPPVYRAPEGRPITQYEFAKAGIVTQEMIYVAHRENLGRAAALAGAAERRADGEDFGAAIPDFVTP